MESRPPKRLFPFSINDILNTPPPPKKLRQGFLINQLLGLTVQDGEGAESASAKKLPSEFVEKLECSVEHIAKFHYTKVQSRFVIRDVPADPESLLSSIFKHCIDEAKSDSREKSSEPTHLGCMISSALLTNGDVFVPVRQITANTIDTILNLFTKVAQSKQQNGVTLWGEPFTITITTVDRSSLPAKRHLKGGARRRLAPVRHQITEKCLIKIRNQDNFCLFYALQATMVSKTRGLSASAFYEYIHGRYGQRGKFQEETRQLMRQVRAPFDLDTYDADTYVPRVIDHWNNTQQQHRLAVFIFGASGHYKPLYKYGTDDYNTPLTLYFNNNHFDGVQFVSGLFAGRKYCLACEQPYTRAAKHTQACKAHCMMCSRVGPTFPCAASANYFFKRCDACSKDFRNNDCFQHHLRSNFCNRSKKCKDCGVIWNVNDNKRKGREGHVCGEKFCNLCNNFHNTERGCFIQRLAARKQQPYRIVAFDLETMQHLPTDPLQPERRKHEPNFIAARVVCSVCIDNNKWRSPTAGCPVCGPYRTAVFCQQPFNGTTVDKKVVTDNPMEAFVDWLVFKQPMKYDTYAYSHFGGRFDMVITFRELFRRGFNPEMIRQGNKMYEMKVQAQKKKNPKVVFRDSFNLMPCALGQLVPAYGLDVVEKPFFPHMANRPENYGRQIYPTPDDYLAQGMMPEKRRQFDQWYEQHRHEPFLLDDALASYCTNDVDILMAALVAFRREFFEITKRQAVNETDDEESNAGIDVLRECMTIASACMKYFRSNHLPVNHLAIVPERGYDNAQNQSLLALRFFKWYEEKHGVKLQTAHSAGGERRVANYSLDAWIETEKRAIEVNGCVWHGCAKCFPEDNMLLPNGKSAGEVRERDAKRLDFLRNQIGRVDVYWECEIDQMLAADPEMRQMFGSYVDDGPLEIRAAFMGGRTGPRKLFHKAKEGEKISYFDFTSLYPFVNFETSYPVGHPKVHVLNQEVDWRCATDNPYDLSLLKVWVVPPRRCDVPVLPVKVGDRLCFPLCIKCAVDYPTGGVDNEYNCIHNDQQRGWVSTCTSLELNAALDEGYRVTKLFRVLQYESSDDQLFKSYIREFMAQKIQATGFDANIKGNTDLEEQFVRECYEKYGITIEQAKMEPNKGKRSIAKLCLNNLWGRFSLRNFGLSQTLITDDPAVFAEYLDNRSLDVTAIDQLDNEHMLISYEKKKEWVEEHACSNIVISLWTTSAARLLLLRAMQKVVRTPGCVLLYTDTDSLIFAHPIGLCPLQTGPHLGQFTDEYPKHEILEFCSGGAKQYGLKLRRKDAPANADNEYVLKVRGMTLNYDVIQNQGLRYDTFKDKVLRYAETGEPQPINVMYPNFLRPSIKDGRVISCPLQKIYKPFVGKGIVGADYKILDFGHTL